MVLKRFIYITIIIQLSALTGCRTVKAPSTPYEMWASDEIETKQEQDLLWNSIRENEFDTSKPLPLTELIDIALNNSPDTRQVWQSARAAEAEVKKAVSAYYPQLSASGTVGRQKKDSDLELDEEQNALYYGPSGKLTFLLLDFGGRSASVRETINQLVAANLDFNRSLQNLILSVEQAYYGLYSAQSKVKAAELNVKDAKAAFDAAQQKLAVGLGAKPDVLQAKSVYDNSLYMLEDARGQVLTSQASLARVLGFPADVEFSIAGPSDVPPVDITREEVGKLIDDAVRQRPDIAALRASLRAEQAGLRAASSELWPTLNLGATAQRSWYELYGDDDINVSETEYSGYASVNWDFFDGFYKLNNMKGANAEVGAAREKLKQSMIQASTDVWTYYYSFKTAASKLTYGKASLESSLASYELIFQGYNSGLKSILDVLDAQAKLSQARSNLIESTKDLYVALANLANSVGSVTAKGGYNDKLKK